MANINDVAKLAKTSKSTVSNYLNKSKYVGPDLSKRIQQAITDLNYIPNKAAKSLKTMSSTDIHIVLPNIQDPQFSHTYTGISKAILNTEYNLILHITDDLPAKENRILEKIQKSSPAGLIICSSLTEVTPQLKRLNNEVPLVFLYRKVNAVKNALSITFDNDSIIFKITKHLLDQSMTDIGLITGPDKFTSEASCINAYKKAHTYTKEKISTAHIHHAPYEKEDVFRHLSLTYCNKKMPNVFITTSNIFYTPLKDCYHIQGIKDYTIITLGYESWYNKDLSHEQIQTIRDCESLGKDAAIKTITLIEKPKSIEKREYIYQDNFELDSLNEIINRKFLLQRNKKNTDSKSINLLLLEDPLSVNAIKFLCKKFTNKTGIEVNITTESYQNLYNTIKQKSNVFDLCSVDMPWLTDLVENNSVLGLDKKIDLSKMKDIDGQYTYPSRLGLVSNQLFGIPYIIGLQLLFYRKDLFDNKETREQFYAIYGRELEPPTDWFSYNQIANFFTKTLNSNSPVNYGTCLADYFKESILGEILPRIWAYDGNIIDSLGAPHLLSPNIEKAFENYIEASKYGTINTPHFAEDVAKIFSKGEIAMITSYVSYAPILFDRRTSTVYDKIGFHSMPSNSSMISGWSLCINCHSKKTDHAIDFLNWFLSTDISYRYSLITGNPIRNSLFSNPSLKKLYPWLDLAENVFENGHTRKIIADNLRLENVRDVLENTIANIVYRHQSSKSSIHSLLKQADRDLSNLLQ